MKNILSLFLKKLNFVWFLDLTITYNHTCNKCLLKSLLKYKEKISCNEKIGIYIVNSSVEVRFGIVRFGNFFPVRFGSVVR